MKVESVYGHEVFIEDWKTPLMHNEQLWLLAEVQIKSMRHFFFQVDSDNDVDVHVMTITGRSPLRFTDETYAYNCIGKYLERKIPRKDGELPSSTLKLWNTSFIEQIEENNALSGYSLERNRDICQYLIITEDDWIEFIPIGPIEWALHKNIDLVDLINMYANK